MVIPEHLRFNALSVTLMKWKLSIAPSPYKWELWKNPKTVHVNSPTTIDSLQPRLSRVHIASKTILSSYFSIAEWWFCDCNGRFNYGAKRSLDDHRRTLRYMKKDTICESSICLVMVGKRLQEMSITSFTCTEFTQISSYSFRTYNWHENV